MSIVVPSDKGRHNSAMSNLEFGCIYFEGERKWKGGLDRTYDPTSSTTHVW
jgi:hypothetical protein